MCVFDGAECCAADCRKKSTDTEWVNEMNETKIIYILLNC